MLSRVVVSTLTVSAAAKKRWVTRPCMQSKRDVMIDCILAGDTLESPMRSKALALQSEIRALDSSDIAWVGVDVVVVVVVVVVDGGGMVVSSMISSLSSSSCILRIFSISNPLRTTRICSSSSPTVKEAARHWLSGALKESVSYTHLTLPTILLV